MVNEATRTTAPERRGLGVGAFVAVVLCSLLVACGASRLALWLALAATYVSMRRVVAEQARRRAGSMPSGPRDVIRMRHLS